MGSTSGGQAVLIPLRGKGDDGLAGISRNMGLNLTVDEMRRISRYFEGEGRDPTDVELQALAQAWSEHCCYKSSRATLRRYIFPLTNEDEVARGDAGVMMFDGEHAYALRIESHNHPSAVEPYGGAATGIGGILRDILAMGAQPVALIDPLFFGDPRSPLTGDGSALHSKYLFGGVVAGIRDYGNRVGIPTVAGCVHFDDGYRSNCLVNVGCIGIARLDEVQRNAVSGPGDLLVLCGGRTGRDGIHGVTFASAVITERTRSEERSAVQLGDPILKEPLIHACREAVQRGLLTGMKDLGGGGLSCVVGEMALAGGCGALVHLERVPLKEEGMHPWEIWVSESQERMMLAVRPERLAEVQEVFDHYDVEATVVGESVPGNRVKVLWEGGTVLDLDTGFYTKGPEYRRAMVMPLPTRQGWVPPEPPGSLRACILEMLADINVSSREWVVRQYDHQVRGCTVIPPLGGIGARGHDDGVVLKPVEESMRGLALGVGCDPWASQMDPYIGGMRSVDEALRNVAAVGGRARAITNCLNLGNPERPECMGAFHEMVRGISTYCREAGLAAPSGNVSFYNEEGGMPVPPTPVILAAGIVEEVTRCVTPALSSPGNDIYLLGKDLPGMGASLLMRKYGGYDPVIPSPDPVAAPGYTTALVEAIDSGLVESCHDISIGGMLTALAEMCISGGLGAEVITRMDRRSMFSEAPTRWLIEVGPGNRERVQHHFRGLSLQRVARVSKGYLSIGSTRIRTDALLEAWSAPLRDLMG